MVKSSPEAQCTPQRTTKKYKKIKTIIKMKAIKIISKSWFLAARNSWIAVSITGDTRLMKGCC